MNTCKEIAHNAELHNTTVYLHCAENDILVSANINQDTGITEFKAQDCETDYVITHYVMQITKLSIVLRNAKRLFQQALEWSERENIAKKKN